MITGSRLRINIRILLINIYNFNVGIYMLQKLIGKKNILVHRYCVNEALF